MNIMVQKCNGKISFEVWLAETELQKALKILCHLKMSTENIFSLKKLAVLSKDEKNHVNHAN